MPGVERRGQLCPCSQQVPLSAPRPSLCIKLHPFICTNHLFVQALLFPSPAFLLR